MRLIHGRTRDIETLTPDDGLGGGKACHFDLFRKPPFSEHRYHMREYELKV